MTQKLELKFISFYEPRFIFNQDRCVGFQVEILARTVRTDLQCCIFPLEGSVHAVGKTASSRVQGDHQPSPSFVNRADGAFQLISVTLLLPSS